MTKLSDLLSAAISASGMSGRALSRQARELGFSLNHDTAARYLRGDHGQPDEETLEAFSQVLTLPMQQLREAANLPAETTEPYVPPREAARLTRRQRRAVDEIIRAMLEPRTLGQSSDQTAEVLPLDPNAVAGPTALSRAGIVRPGGAPADLPRGAGAPEQAEPAAPPGTRTAAQLAAAARRGGSEGPN
jgi:hypothetical protein